MKRPGPVILAALATAVLLTAGLPAGAAVTEGAKAPLAAISGVVDAKGAPIDLARLVLAPAAEAGHPAAQATLLVFWASWCHPCINEIPVLNELHRFYGKRGLRVLGLGVREGDETLQGLNDAAAKHGISYPILFDSGGKAQEAFELGAVPMSALIDASGIVRWIGPALPSNAAARIDAVLGLSERRGAK